MTAKILAAFAHARLLPKAPIGLNDVVGPPAIGSGREVADDVFRFAAVYLSGLLIVALAVVRELLRLLLLLLGNRLLRVLRRRELVRIVVAVRLFQILDGALSELLREQNIAALARSQR